MRRKSEFMMILICLVTLALAVVATAGAEEYATLGDPGYTTLSEALDTIGNRLVTLNVPAETIVPVTQNTTIPPNISLKVYEGAEFQVNTGITLNLNSSFEAGRYKVFSPTGSGKVQFGSNSSQIIYPEWFNAIGDGSTNDKAAFQATLNAMAPSMACKLADKSYYIDGKVYWPQTAGLSLSGHGQGRSNLIINDSSGNNPGIYLKNQGGTTVEGMTIKDLTIRGRADEVTPPKGMVYLEDVSNAQFINVEFKNAKQYGVVASCDYGCANVVVRDCLFHEINTLTMPTHDNGSVIWGNFNGLIVDNCDFENVNLDTSRTTDHAIYVSGSSKNISIKGNNFDGQNARVHIYNNGDNVIDEVMVADNFFNNVRYAAHFNDCAQAEFTRNSLKDSGIILSENSSVTINSNHFDGNFVGLPAIALAHGEYHNIIGNQFLNQSDHQPIALSSGSTASDVLISLNHIETTQGHCINLNGNSNNGILILNNYLASGNTYAIKIEDGTLTNVLIQGNNIFPGGSATPIQCFETDLEAYALGDNYCDGVEGYSSSGDGAPFTVEEGSITYHDATIAFDTTESEAKFNISIDGNPSITSEDTVIKYSVKYQYQDPGYYSVVEESIIGEGTNSSDGTPFDFTACLYSLIGDYEDEGNINSFTLEYPVPIMFTANLDDLTGNYENEFYMTSYTLKYNTPIPGSVWLLATGLFGLWSLGRLRKG